jgi:hypothetical protein
MDPPDDDEVEAAAPPQQRRRQTRGVRWVEWTLRVTVSFVILSLLKLEPIARNSVRDHNSSIDLPHQEEKLLKSSTDDNDSQNKIINSSSSSVVRNNKYHKNQNHFLLKIPSKTVGHRLIKLTASHSLTSKMRYTKKLQRSPLS